MLYRLIAKAIPSTTPFDQWCDEFIKLVELRDLLPATVEKRKCNIGHLKNAIGRTRIGSVRPLHIATAVREIHGSGRQNTARSVLREAKQIFNEAVIAGLVNVNPAATLQHLPAPVKRTRLRLEEWQALYEESLSTEPYWVSRMLLLALITGQRRADLQKMKFSDVKDGHLFVEQQKTGMRVALPMKLRLNVIKTSLDQVIKSCKKYSVPGETLLRKHNGKPFCNNYMTARFRDLFVRVLNHTGSGTSPSLHECRSLSERLYREQGIDTQVLLGHKHRRMTDEYNNDRGLDRDKYKFLTL